MKWRIKRWHGRRYTEAEQRGALRGVERAGEHLLQVSRTQVPLEEGTLERSGVVVVDPSKPASHVTYDTVYAVRQHEELTWRHAAGRKAKYLEDPHASERDVMREILAAEIRRSLGT